jgi:PAS domain S-box-containing protein
MKELLSNISFKTKYFPTLIASLFFASNTIYFVFTYSKSSTNSDKLFNILAVSEIFLIVFISFNLYSLIKNNAVFSNDYGMMTDDIYESVNIFNTISEGIIVVDSKGKVRKINQGLCSILGIEDKQIVGKSLYNFLNEKERGEDSKLLSSMVIETLEAQKEFRQQEKVVARNSAVCYLSVSTYMLRNKYKRVIGVFAVVHDCTQRKRLEQRLKQIENLATIGQMSAELAHEIKNPICAIKGLIQIMGKKQGLEENKYYEVITGEIDRINILLQRFLSSTQNSPKLEKVNIKNIFEGVAPLVDSYAESKHISINVDMQKEMPDINADKENIKQVIINIVQNGIDALPINGKMNISIWYDHIMDLVKMDFKDNGCGIRQEHLDKIFEPFFTTKNNGSGLGLAISHKIIEKHCGKLFAFNNLDGGATFVIELPVIKGCENNIKKVF